VHEWSLLERVADFMAAKDSRLRGDVLMQTVLLVVNGLRCALFERQQEILHLHASSGLDQEVLGVAQDAWATRRPALQAGVTLLGHRTSKVSPSGNVCWAVAPVLCDRRLLGALYVDSAAAGFEGEGDLRGLAHLARMAAGFLVETPESVPLPLDDYISRLTLDEIGREQLALLISRHEGNVARIARLLKVTRATVYNRLRKHGLLPLLQTHRPNQT
jgi:hypothetical protein